MIKINQTYVYKTEECYLHYFGNRQQATARFRLPTDKKYEVEIMDFWEMTMNKLGDTFSGIVKVPLPPKPYIAVRAKIPGK